MLPFETSRDRRAELAEREHENAESADQALLTVCTQAVATGAAPRRASCS